MIFQSEYPLLRLKACVDVRPSGVDKHSFDDEIAVRLCNYTDVYKYDHITGDMDFLQATATEAEINRFTLSPGDVIITKDSETPEDIAASALVMPSAKGVVCGYHLALLRPYEAFYGPFVAWAMRSREVLSQFTIFARGITRFGLTTDAIGSVLVPTPPAKQQRAIAAFLDRETAKIDALIAEQERLIALLQEKRQAVISQAVTKGLDPTVPMKDSGVEQMAKIPASWKIVRLKQLILQGSSISYGIVQPGEPLDAGVPFIQTTNISSGDFDPDNLQKTTAEIAALYPRSKLVGGEVILGIRASIGAAYVVPNSLAGTNLSRGIARIEPGNQVTSQFLVCFLRSSAVKSYWEASKQGSTFNEVSIDTVRHLPVAVPPLSEQEAIVRFIDMNCRNIDRLRDDAGQAVILLRERRAALISAAVTGKIDVREAGAEPAEAA